MMRLAGSKVPHARLADRFWLSQVGLMLFALFLAGGVALGRDLELTNHVLAVCQRTALTLTTHGWTIVLLMPPLLIVLSVILAGLSIGRQMWTTKRLLRALGPPRPLTPELYTWEQCLDLAGRLRLAADPRPLAFCAGSVRPVIWLTTGLLTALDQNELAAVLRHERHHVRHRDPLKLLLVRALADAFFYLPLMRDLGHGYEVHKELAADAEAALPPDGRVGLARALIKLLADAPPELSGAAVGPLLGARSSATEARVDHLTRGTQPALAPRRHSVLLSGFAMLLLLLVTLLPMAEPAHAEWGGSCAEEEMAPLTISLGAL